MQDALILRAAPHMFRHFVPVILVHFQGLVGGVETQLRLLSTFLEGQLPPSYLEHLASKLSVFWYFCT